MFNHFYKFAACLRDNRLVYQDVAPGKESAELAKAAEVAEANEDKEGAKGSSDLNVLQRQEEDVKLQLNSLGNKHQDLLDRGDARGADKIYRKITALREKQIKLGVRKAELQGRKRGETVQDIGVEGQIKFRVSVKGKDHFFQTGKQAETFKKNIEAGMSVKEAMKGTRGLDVDSFNDKKRTKALNLVDKHNGNALAKMFGYKSSADAYDSMTKREIVSLIEEKGFSNKEAEQIYGVVADGAGEFTWNGKRISQVKYHRLKNKEAKTTTKTHKTAKLDINLSAGPDVGDVNDLF